MGKSPVLNVETVGPRRITVGKSSAYEVRIKNSGKVAADEVVVLVNLPLWADLMTSQTSVGTATTSQTDTSQPLRWAVGRLDAGASGKLALKIVPRESRPFDLAVRWDYRPVVSQTMIEVQEPKLMLQVEGPRDVLYGDREVFKVKLTNTGNGDAENVKISLRSGGDDDDQAVSQNLGHLPPGQQKTIKVELTPRQAGNLMIDVGVTADNGVHAELTETILVRRASLQAAMQGPAMQYVGAAVDYRLLVRNTGNADAKNVNMTFNLPATVEYISGISDATVSDDGGRLLWTLPNLPPSGEKEFLIRCRLAAAGKKMFKVVSATEDGLSDSVSVFT
ncbi:MAG: CARDB domain-containing protein, partial [Thermoguttaceae bacterium]